MLKKLTTFNTEDSSLNRLMNLLQQVINPIVDNQLLDSTFVKSVPLAVGDNVVNHKLNRSVVGWIVTRKRGPGNFYDKQDTNPTPTKNIIINSDTIVTVDFYFF